MREYTLLFARSARKELEALGTPLQVRVLVRIESLAQTPRPSGCRKLAGAKDLWRIRVGDYRVVYSIDDISSIIEVLLIRHRRDVYR